ncbi:class I adenylate-forming enzyme family protein [Granulicella sp. WH15]|uniref:class I adenylate-forming enzyme family protein n=1 Tax=Granulicella sp. WH15 TaxID=2602070 RepID=UPI001C70009C|nr:class I adenylate-forming enzyme family protein [Granulicella sp. WH15]
MSMQSGARWSNLGAALSQDGNQDDPAIIDLGGETPPTTYSYRQLHELVQAIARGLLALGLSTGDRVAVVSANRAEYLAVFFAAMQAGLVPVPLNIKLPAAGIDLILRDAGARLVFCDAERASLCPTDIPRVCFGKVSAGTEAFEAFLSPGAFTPDEPVPDQAAMFLYTSGSTGVPKGVVLSHESHLWVLKMRRRPASTERLRTLIAAPLYHMNALATAHAALAQHDSVVLLPGFDVPTYIDAIERYKCNALTAVPTMFSMILKRPDLLARTDLSSVRSLRMGSAPVSPALFESLRKLFPNAQIANVYGTTEAGPIVFAPHPDGVPTPALSLGFKHPEVSLRIDGKGTGEADGVLEIKSPALLTEYYGRPEMTRKVFTEDGYYRTGDVFHRDALGFYFYVGRADDMFSCGAENIYPGEVEKMLERHSAVQQVAVVPIPDEIKGAKPVAFVVLKPHAQASEREIQQFALANAPAYQHPRRVWFVSELPLASTNKIDTKALIASALSNMQSDPEKRTT